MKRNFLIALMFVATASFAAAQASDILGAHLNYGRGCAACHAPHSGAAGNGGGKAPNQPGIGSDTGSVALWGEDASGLYTQTPAFGASTYTESFAGGIGSGTPDATGVLMCLSCHDGNYAEGAMMKNQVYESLPSTYGTAVHIPTLLGNNGVSGPGNASYLTDHPVGPNAKFGCNSVATPESGYNWDCASVTAVPNGRGGFTPTIVAGPNMANFVNNYGFFVSLASNGGGAPYVVCTTCHNQHVMNVVNVTALKTAATSGASITAGASGMSGVQTTMFFLRGPYNPNNTSSNSAAQFCRQCHGGESNEMNGVQSVTTTN